MKKIRRLLTTLIASTVMAAPMGVLSASAERSHDLADMDKVVFSIKDYDNPLWSSYEYGEFIIDENYNINHVFVWDSTSVAVRMTDGEAPEVEDDSLEVSKLSKYQLSNMGTGSKWAVSYDVAFDVDDDVYCVSGFESTATAEIYCTNVLEGGKADYAKPISYVEYSVAYPDGASASEYLKENGVDSAAFGEDLFGFTLTFNSAEEAEGFDINSIADFADNLYTYEIVDNVMYFQLVKEAEGEIMTNVLCALQESEAVSEVGVIPYAHLEDGETGTAGEIPEDYPIGDADMNNVVDLYDVIAIAEYLIDMRTFDESEAILADYDENGTVDIYDAIAIAETLI